MKHTAMLPGLVSTAQSMLRILSWAVLLLVSRQSHGEDAVPQPYPVQRYEPIWKKSPFTLSSAADAEAAGAFGDKLKLTGVLKIGEQPYVSLFDSESGKRFLVSSQTDSQGIKLESLQGGDDLGKVLVVLTRNGETVKLRYDMDYLKQASAQAAGPAPQTPTPSVNGAVTIRPVAVAPVSVAPANMPPPAPNTTVRRRILIPSQSTGS